MLHATAGVGETQGPRVNDVQRRKAQAVPMAAQYQHISPVAQLSLRDQGQAVSLAFA